MSPFSEFTDSAGFSPSPRSSGLEPGTGDIFVLGAGGHSKVVVSALLAAKRNVKAVYDDDPAKRGTEVLKVPVVGTITGLVLATQGNWIIGVGDNRTRYRMAARVRSATWATVIHPKAYVHESASLGAGTVVFAGALVQPGVCIGRHCIINTGATVDHDCVVGDFCHIAPGCNLGGAVTLAEGAFMGIGSVAIQNVTVGAWTIVGAGAAVAGDLPDHVVAVGVPARVRRKLDFVL